jgi:hypothetical protein
MMNLTEMVVLETDFVQRAYDNKWEKVVKIMDTENGYTYRNENGVSVTLIPEKWVTVDVIDYMAEIVD